MVSPKRQEVNSECFRSDLDWLPFGLRLIDIEHAMLDVYDFLYDVNEKLLRKGLRRFDDFARPQLLSGLISDLITDAIGSHTRSLVVNRHHNGHPDLIVVDMFPNNAVADGGPTSGIEVKSTNKPGGGVDTHGARNEWLMVFTHETDRETEPARDRSPTRFVEVYCALVQEGDFRRNNRRTAIGTNTSALHAQGLRKLRAGWVYLDVSEATRKRRLRGTGLS